MVEGFKIYGNPISEKTTGGQLPALYRLTQNSVLFIFQKWRPSALKHIFNENLEMLVNLWLILLLICCVQSQNMIWDEDCEAKECSGSPVRGDGLNSFDDWDGSTRTYSTGIKYTCADGLGFDTTGSPSTINGYCGKKCDGGYFGCYAGWEDPAECRDSDPEWRISGGLSQLPECNVGEETWRNFLWTDFFFFQLLAIQTYYLLCQMPITHTTVATVSVVTATRSLCLEKRPW